jgi:hypothetical protein
MIGVKGWLSEINCLGVHFPLYFLSPTSVGPTESDGATPDGDCVENGRIPAPENSRFCTDFLNPILPICRSDRGRRHNA